MIPVRQNTKCIISIEPYGYGFYNALKYFLRDITQDIDTIYQDLNRLIIDLLPAYTNSVGVYMLDNLNLSNIIPNFNYFVEDYNKFKEALSNYALELLFSINKHFPYFDRSIELVLDKATPTYIILHVSIIVEDDS
jgi:hypothetical protein